MDQALDSSPKWYEPKFQQDPIGSSGHSVT